MIIIIIIIQSNFQSCKQKKKIHWTKLKVQTVAYQVIGIQSSASPQPHFMYRKFELLQIRTALKDTTLTRGGGPDGGEPIGILKDTPVAYMALYMQRREDFYPDS